MKILERKKIKLVELVGRKIEKAVGKDSYELSHKMTVGFAHYSKKYGTMEPHRHAEELLYILDAKKSWMRSGPTKDRLGKRIPFLPGTLVHFNEMEWHVFEYEDDGFVDLIFFYGQVDNIRPEDTKK